MGLSPRIGIFGGSFDPPHQGHRALVEAALKRLLLDELWVIPVGQAVHRKLSAGVTAKQRLLLARQMFSGINNVKVLDWEVMEPLPVPSCDTWRRIRREYPDISPIFLLGMDAWENIEHWVGYPIHRELCNVAVFSRAGVTPCHIDGWQTLHLTAWQKRQWQGAGHVIWLTDTLPDMSATRIREQLASGQMPLAATEIKYGALLQQWYGPQCIQRNE